MMPHQSIWKEIGLHRQFTGNITGREVLESNLWIQGDGRFKNIKYIFNDFTQIENFDISNKDVELVSVTDDIAATYSSELKIIIVATNEGFLKWVRLYLSKMENSPFNIVLFEDMEKALKSIS